jgi:hypothetical protein
MPKITLIGAGSVVFTRNLCSDILLTPALQESTIALMDIDPKRLAWARDLVEAIIEQRGLKAQVEATTDRREAVQDADYVITTFQQGGLDAYKLDIEIPQRYGVEQCVGDTLGPGGVFRALRTIPVLIDLCYDMDDLAPDALLINYVNPMAANCWAVAEGYQRDAGQLGWRALRQGSLSLRWHQPSSLVSGVPPGQKGGSLPTDLGGHRAARGLRSGASAHRVDEVLWLLRYRVQRSRQRVRTLFPQECPDGE